MLEKQKNKKWAKFLVQIVCKVNMIVYNLIRNIYWLCVVQIAMGWIKQSRSISGVL